MSVGICLSTAYVLLLFMLINASSMFEFHMLVAFIVMLNIQKLIMELLSNYPTEKYRSQPVSVQYNNL